MSEDNKPTLKSKELLLMDENERLARKAEKDNDYGAAKVYWQLSQIEAKSLIWKGAQNVLKSEVYPKDLTKMKSTTTNRKMSLFMQQNSAERM